MEVIKVLCFKHLLGFKLTKDLRIDLVYTIHRWGCWKNGRFFLPFQKVPDSFCEALFLQDPNQTKNQTIAVSSRLEMSNPHSPTSTEFKSVCAAFWMINHFPACKSFPSHYSIDIFLTDVSANYIP